MKKGDIIVIVSVVAALILSVVGISFFSNTGSRVVVKQNNEIVYTASLDKDDTVVLKDNTVIIKDGYVYMQSASCKNQVCVNTGKISKEGESIICLPNKVVVEIK